MKLDADGIARYDIVGSILRADGKVTPINLSGLHEYELEATKREIRRRARKGDTVDVKVV
jgi:hypothetical protein